MEDEMKKLVLSIIVVILLAACIPAPTETPTPMIKEVQASMPEQLYGIWYNPNHHTFWEFSGDATGSGKVNVYLGLGDLYEIAYFTIKEGIITFGKSEYQTCNDVPATYEIILLLENNTVAGMHLNLVGDDACRDRKDGFVGNTLNHVAP